jgi:hypothetical protein
MNIQKKQKTLIYLALLIIGMMVLAASLSELQFQPGMPFPGAETSQTSNDPVNESTKPMIEFRPLIQLPLAITFFLLLIVLFIPLVKKIKLIKILKLSVGLFVVLCLFLFLNQIKSPSPVSSNGDSQGFGIKPSFSVNIAPIGNPPTEMFWFVMIALIIGAVFVIMWLLFQALHQPQKDELIANEAGAALKAIESGCDLRNVIIRCYMQMLSIAEEEQGIERLNSMTPREFECILKAKGIPYPPIHQLTTLFEKVRYGSKPTSLSDENVAIECLSAIQLSCRSGDREFK